MTHVRMYNIDAYFAYYYAIRQFCRTNEEAYRCTEDLAIVQYGINIIKCYDNFRLVKHRYEQDYPTPGEEKRYLLTAIGYFNRFYALLDDYPTAEQAWQGLESEVYAEFSTHMYDNYEAFKVARGRYIKDFKKHKDKTILKFT